VNLTKPVRDESTGLISPISVSLYLLKINKWSLIAHPHAVPHLRNTNEDHLHKIREISVPKLTALQLPL